MGKNVVFAQNSDGTEFADPMKACDEIREVLTRLGKHCKRASPRDCFEKLIDWCNRIPLNQKPLIKRFVWIDDVNLAPLPEEIKKLQEEHKAEQMRMAKEAADEAKKVEDQRLAKEAADKAEAAEQLANLSAELPAPPPAPATTTAPAPAPEPAPAPPLHRHQNTI